MKNLLTLLLSLLAVGTLAAQQLGELKTSVLDYGTRKFEQSGNRIYIADFNVHYQVLFSATNSQAAQKKRNGFRAGSRVSSAVALPGIPEAELLRITDEMYAGFRAQLEAAGYTFIDADGASGIDAYEDWTRVEGGTVSRAQVNGYVTVTPQGADFYVPRIKNSGKRGKKFFDNTPYISSQLDDAIVARVDIYVPFAEDGESGWSRSLGRMTDESKVVLRTRMRLGSPTVIQETGLRALTTSISDQFSGPPPATRILFASGRVGAGSTAQYAVSLKKDLEISGVMNDEKIKRYAVGGYDFTPSYVGSLGLYSAESQEVDSFVAVDYDLDAYLEGVRRAVDAYVTEAVSGFIHEAK